jgi:hypothetical protein
MIDGDGETRQLWSNEHRTRHFLIPADAELPPGDLRLRTAAGREMAVDEAAALPFEVTEEEAKRWAKEELSATLGELRGNTLAFVQRLRARTEGLREENRRTWEEGVAAAPENVREAAGQARGWLRDLGQVLQRAAREHRAKKEPEDQQDPPPPRPPSDA